MFFSRHTGRTDTSSKINNEIKRIAHFCPGRYVNRTKIKYNANSNDVERIQGQQSRKTSARLLKKCRCLEASLSRREPINIGRLFYPGLLKAAEHGGNQESVHFESEIREDRQSKKHSVVPQSAGASAFYEQDLGNNAQHSTLPESGWSPFFPEQDIGVQTPQRSQEPKDSQFGAQLLVEDKSSG